MKTRRPFGCHWILGLLVSVAQPVVADSAGTLTLVSTVGSEDVSSQTSMIRISASGAVTVDRDFRAEANGLKAGARDRGFNLILDAVSVAGLDPGAGLGRKVRDGLMDRDSTGRLGVRGGSNGINEREGFLIGLDAGQTEEDGGWQLTGVRFTYVGDGESYRIINLSQPERFLEGDGDGIVDVTELGLFVKGGGAVRELVSIVAGTNAIATSSGFRIDGFRFAETDAPLKPVRSQKRLPRMHFADRVSGRPFSKDPAVVRFRGRYWMYYSVPDYFGKGTKGWTIGVATSGNLVDWSKVGELRNTGEAEANGFTAPGAIVLGSRVHLFYQTYGNREKDAICHAWSTNGLDFHRNPENPVFRPSGDWNSGRAIDADVIPHGDRLLLYWATRDPGMKVQMQGVAAAPLDGDFGRAQWTQLNPDGPILAPGVPTALDAVGLDLAWEKRCIEAAAMARHDGRLYMFYAGGYNNEPQQIGVAVSDDGVAFKRLSDRPFLANGLPGSWNSSESGHPFLFQDEDGRDYLFYQGNDTHGQTWYLSVVPVDWVEGKPVAAPERLPSR